MAMVRLDFQPFRESGCLSSSQGTRAHKTAGNRAYAMVGLQENSTVVLCMYKSFSGVLEYIACKNSMTSASYNVALSSILSLVLIS